MRQSALARLALLAVVAVSVWLPEARAAEHNFIPIDTCYHWLSPAQLEYKLDYARKNNGELAFFGNKVIFCWRTPLGAQSPWEDHGDELIRIKFKPGVKIIHQPREHDATRAAQSGDVRYSNNDSWHEYTIILRAVESWSVYHPHTIVEMKADLAHLNSGRATADDVFYPASIPSILGFLNSTIADVIRRHEGYAAAGKSFVFGKNPERHFETSVNLPWRQMLNRDGSGQVVVVPTPVPAPPPPAPAAPPQLKIKITLASYGANLTGESNGNATAAAATFCDGKPECQYKVHPKFLRLREDRDNEKDFRISWHCGDGVLMNKVIPAPAIHQVFDIVCK